MVGSIRMRLLKNNEKVIKINARKRNVTTARDFLEEFLYQTGRLVQKYPIWKNVVQDLLLSWAIEETHSGVRLWIKGLEEDSIVEWKVSRVGNTLQVRFEVLVNGREPEHYIISPRRKEVRDESRKGFAPIRKPENSGDSEWVEVPGGGIPTGERD